MRQLLYENLVVILDLENIMYQVNLDPDLWLNDTINAIIKQGK